MIPQQPQSPQSVLIVDPSDDARQVLRTVLARRGVKIWEAREGAAGLQLARDMHPDVIVLDAESDDDPACQALASQAGEDETPLILLGTARRAAGPGGEYVAKPYQYGPLIHKIESLLTEAKDTLRRCA